MSAIDNKEMLAELSLDDVKMQRQLETPLIWIFIRSFRGKLNTLQRATSSTCVQTSELSFTKALQKNCHTNALCLSVAAKYLLYKTKILKRNVGNFNKMEYSKTDYSIYFILAFLDFTCMFFLYVFCMFFCINFRDCTKSFRHIW